MLAAQKMDIKTEYMFVCSKVPHENNFAGFNISFDNYHNTQWRKKPFLTNLYRSSRQWLLPCPKFPDWVQPAVCYLH